VRTTPVAPMAELRSSVTPTGDTVVASAATLSANVTGALGGTVRFVKNGAPLPAVDVTTDPFETSAEITAPTSGEDRYRVEIAIQSQLQTITSHLWVKAPAAPQDAGAGGGAAAGAGGSQGPSGPASPGGCGCSVTDASEPAWLLPLLALTAAARRRRRGRADAAP
jgi:MYXO-CTERM domain-containing protein